MTFRRRQFGFAVAVIVAVALTGGRVSALMDPCSDDSTHGIYTTAFCNGDTMTGEGAYISSPDGNYRLYISAGHLSVYYQSTWQWDLYNAGDGNAYQMGFNYSGLMGSVISAWDQYQTQVYSGWSDNENAPADFIRLDNDGCLRFYYSNGVDFSLERCS